MIIKTVEFSYKEEKSPLEDFFFAITLDKNTIIYYYYNNRNVNCIKGNIMCILNEEMFEVVYGAASNAIHELENLAQHVTNENGEDMIDLIYDNPLIIRMRSGDYSE